jgi:phage shock protein PspC (stress-responsive transcriptional regulator)
MQPVITISLNRNAFQLEKDAHSRLEAYLAEAASKLDGNPDRTEILQDLEQAIADQCRKRMQPNQNVITLGELQPALEEIGAVEVPGSSPPPRVTPAVTSDAAPALQQVSDGAIISGICMGLSRAARLDVTLLRVIAVVLLFVTGGAMILLYVILMLLIPFAPLEPNGPPLRKIPAKSREYVQLIRSKLSALTS